jgi:hypothetical protein
MNQYAHARSFPACGNGKQEGRGEFSLNVSEFSG